MKFENEFLDQSPDAFFDLTQRYVKERFLGVEIRQEAIHRMMQSLMELLPEDLQEEQPKLLRMADFMEAIGEPPQAIVGEILPAKKLIAFSGAAKEGKSLVALEILENVATGQPLFGEHDIERPGAVAYFGLEDGGSEIKERLLSRGVSDLSNYYVCWQSFDMKTPVGWQTFLSLIEPVAADLSLLVIDTAREAFRGIRDWNDAALVGPIISTLRRWAQKYCTVLLITHNNKDKFAEGVNKISGSGALISSCDGYMILDGQTILDNGDLQWNLEMGGRSVKRSKRFLRMDTNTLRVTELRDEDIERAKQAAKTAEKDASKKRILNELSEVTEKTAQQISESCGMTDRWVRDLLKELISEDLVLRGNKVKTENSRIPVQTFLLRNVCTNQERSTVTVLDSNATSVLNQSDFAAKERVTKFLDSPVEEWPEEEF